MERFPSVRTRQILSSLTAALLPLCLLAACRKDALPPPSGIRPEAVDSLGQELANSLSAGPRDPRLWKACRADPPLRGDLDGDGTADAAVRIHCSWEGPQADDPKLAPGSTTIAVWVFPKSGGRLVGTLEAGGSDDEIQGMDLDSLSQGRLWVTLERLRHGDSPGKPTLREQRSFRVEGRRFVAVP